MRNWRFRLNKRESLLWNHDDEDLSLWWRHELTRWAAQEAQALGFDTYTVCDWRNVSLERGAVSARA